MDKEKRPTDTGFWGLLSANVHTFFAMISNRSKQSILQGGDMQQTSLTKLELGILQLNSQRLYSPPLPHNLVVTWERKEGLVPK